MSYKVVKDATGKVIAYGSGEGYEPFVAQGHTLELIENYVHTKTLAELNSESNAIILAQIADLEAQQARPIREIALGDTTYAVSKLQSLNNQIAALRAQLV